MFILLNVLAVSYIHVHEGRQRRLPTLRLEDLHPLQVHSCLKWHGNTLEDLHPLLVNNLVSYTLEDLHPLRVTHRLKTSILFKYTWFHIT